MASFENQSTNIKFTVTVDDAKKTVSVSNIGNQATAEVLSTVANAMKPLFVSTPSAVNRTSNDLIVD